MRQDEQLLNVLVLHTNVHLDMLSADPIYQDGKQFLKFLLKKSLRHYDEDNYSDLFAKFLIAGADIEWLRDEVKLYDLALRNVSTLEVSSVKF